MIHVFEPVEDGQTRGANQFYSVMERLKMLDTLQATQLQSAIVKAMYAATIESELDSEKAFEYIAAADGDNSPLMKMLSQYSRYYQANNIKLGGVKIPHLYPGDELNLQTAQDSDNGFPRWSRRCFAISPQGWGCPTNSCHEIIRRSVIPAPGHLPTSRGGIFLGAANSLPGGWPHRCLPAGWKRRWRGASFAHRVHVFLSGRRAQAGAVQNGLAPGVWPLTD